MLRSSFLRAVGSTAATATAAASTPTNASNNSEFRFVASDMDGTVLTPEHTLSEYTSETLRRLTQDQHIPFVFATGRFYADVAAVNRDLQRFFQTRRQELPPVPSAVWERTPSYLITSNGAVIHNAETAQMVQERSIDPAVVKELYDFLPRCETRINTAVIRGDEWLCRMNWAELLQYHKQSGCCFKVVEDAAKLESSPAGLQHVHKVFFSCWDRPLLERLEKTLQERYGKDLSVTFSAYHNVDIMAKGVTKASALKQLFEHMAQLPHESAAEATAAQRLKATVAFGDDLNDAAMLTEVGRGFIMGNCNPQLKVRCPHLEVIDTNAKDAVARQLRKLFRLDE